MRIALAAAVALSALVAAQPPAVAETRIVIGNWDGYMPPDLLERFTAATGIAAEHAVHATNEEVMGKLVASGGQGYDVVFLSTPFAEALKKLDLVADLDATMIPNVANLYPEARSLPHDPGNAYSIPYTWGTTGLCYREDLVGAAPTSWMDLLAPKDALAGRITMLSTDRWLIGAAQLALGQSLNDASPEALAKAKELLIGVKPKLLAYDDTTFYSKLVSGEAAMVQAWDGWCNYGIAEDSRIKYVIPAEGSDWWVDVMVVPKASANPAAAHAFIDFVLRPEVGQWVIENVLYKSPNQAATRLVGADVLAAYPNLGLSPAELAKFEQLRDLGDGQRAFSRTVTEILAAQ